MIFSELYSAYYNAIAAIIAKMLEGEESEKAFQKLVAERAFGESVLTILPALKSGKWQLVKEDFTPILTNKPTMPLTTLQKRWLKALSLDPRIRLFGIELPNLDDVEPLFTQDDYHIYDKYGDGDPFEDEAYIRHFRIILDAIREGGQIKFEMTNRHGNPMFVRCRPLRLEYSEKDDKFRLITAGSRAVSTINLAKIRKCARYQGEKMAIGNERAVRFETVHLRVTDERNALERVMLHFAHFEKQTEKLDKTHYLLKIKYVTTDESEILIRILSFGPMVEVVGPENFRNLIIERLKKQKSCGLK